jgi:hypothetical protein
MWKKKYGPVRVEELEQHTDDKAGKWVWKTWILSTQLLLFQKQFLSLQDEANGHIWGGETLNLEAQCPQNPNKMKIMYHSKFWVHELFKLN